MRSLFWKLLFRFWKVYYENFVLES